MLNEDDTRFSVLPRICKVGFQDAITLQSSSKLVGIPDGYSLSSLVTEKRLAAAIEAMCFLIRLLGALVFFSWVLGRVPTWLPKLWIACFVLP